MRIDLPYWTEENEILKVISFNARLELLEDLTVISNTRIRPNKFQEIGNLEELFRIPQLAKRLKELVERQGDTELLILSSIRKGRERRPLDPNR